MDDQKKLMLELCQSVCRANGKIEGRCAAICMSQIGDAPKDGCRYAVDVHECRVKPVLKMLFSRMLVPTESMYDSTGVWNHPHDRELADDAWQTWIEVFADEQLGIDVDKEAK